MSPRKLLTCTAEETGRTAHFTAHSAPLHAPLKRPPASPTLPNAPPGPLNAPLIPLTLAVTNSLDVAESRSADVHRAL